MTIFELYLLTLLPSLAAMFTSLTVLSVVLTFACFLFSQLHDKPLERESFAKLTKFCSKFFIIFLVTATLIPSERQIYVIAGGYVATNTEGVKELPENIVKATNDFLKSISTVEGE